MKIPLHNGSCVKRWSCKNVNKDFCEPVPKYSPFGDDRHVECDYYEDSRKEKIYEEVRFAKITVKGKTKEEVKEQFKLLTQYCDTEVVWLR